VSVTVFALKTTEREGFGVTVADFLSAPSTPGVFAKPASMPVYTSKPFGFSVPQKPFKSHVLFLFANYITFDKVNLLHKITSEREGFGVTALSILLRASTPAYVPFGASMRLNPSKAFAFSGHGTPVQIPQFFSFDCMLKMYKLIW
jgi:hypothetical protein